MCARQVRKKEKESWGDYLLILSPNTTAAAPSPAKTPINGTGDSAGFVSLAVGFTTGSCVTVGVAAGSCVGTFVGFTVGSTVPQTETPSEPLPDDDAFCFGSA